MIGANPGLCKKWHGTADAKSLLSLFFETARQVVYIGVSPRFGLGMPLSNRPLYFFKVQLWTVYQQQIASHSSNKSETVGVWISRWFQTCDALKRGRDLNPWKDSADLSCKRLRFWMILEWFEYIQRNHVVWGLRWSPFDPRTIRNVSPKFPTICNSQFTGWTAAWPHMGRLEHWQKPLLLDGHAESWSLVSWGNMGNNDRLWESSSTGQ